MKKSIFVFMAIATLVAGVNTASADKLYVPMIAHYGSSDYTMIQIKNLSGVITKVSVNFTNAVADAVGVVTSTTSSGTSKTVSIAKNATWTLLTKDTELFSTTSSMKRALVVIQTSATDHPYAAGAGTVGGGPVTVSAMFIHVNSAGSPSGFSYPTMHRTRRWVSSVAGAHSNLPSASRAGLVTTSPSYTIDNWEQ